MKAIVLEEPRRFRPAEIPAAQQPGPGEALVRTHRVGICGTDISGYLGKFPFFSYPRIPGHELGVEVLALGDGVEHLQVGDRCAVEPYINDPASFASRRGASNCCDRLQVLGVHTDGGLREQFVLPARKLHPSSKLAFEQLALVETLGIGCHAVDRCGPSPSDTVLVIGAGPIGLAVMEFVKLTTARLIVLDMNEQRLTFCRDVMGVDATVVFRGDGREEERLREVNSGELPTIVIDATGNAGSMSHALNYCAHTGKLVYVGIVMDELHFPHKLMHAKELTLLASRNSLPRDFGRIIRLIEMGKIDTGPWITHRTPMDGMIDVFESYTKPETGVIKAVVEVS